MKAIAAALLLTCAIPASVRAAEGDSIAAARDLYSAAAYEDALGVLDRIRAGGQASSDVRAIDQYRALCLLALGRTGDAEQAIQALIVADPMFQPPADVSPRVRAAFVEVRRRVLPQIVEDRYAGAKAAFDRKDFAAAQGGFKQVLQFLADPDLAGAAAQPPLSDLKTLAAGFRDLSASALPPPPLPATPTPAPIAAPPPAPVAAAKPLPPAVYGPDDAAVLPPVVIRQDLPTFDYQLLVPPPAGALELVIDERGVVESATMRKSIYPRYDAKLVEATRSWVYRPAMLDGVPVKYRKIVNVSVKK
jgi:hypothetical protein